MTDLHPLVHAGIATSLAVLRLASFATLGGGLVRRPIGPLTLPVRILAGGALVGGANAVLLRLVSSDGALMLDLAVSGVALLLGWRGAVAETEALFAPVLRWLRRRPPFAWSAWALLAIYWINAAAPPRDTDSLRYHLAHIRLIDLAGSWDPAPIPHYAIPFAWQSTYLPFVRFGFPESAQLTSTVLALIAAALLHGFYTRRTTGGSQWRWGALLLALSTGVVMTFTTAGVDAYTVFTALVVTLLLTEAPVERRSALLTGFAAWVAIGSRYHAVAIAVAATVAYIVRTGGHRARGPRLLAFTAGGAAAIALALPFYLSNLAAFGNPVWPLLGGSASDPLVQHVGHAFASSWAGEWRVAYVGQAIGRLLTDRSVFPVPLMLAGALVAGSRTAQRDARTLVTWLTVFLLLWVAAQPMLYPRFALYAMPAGVLLFGTAARARAPLGSPRGKRAVRVAALAAVLGLTLGFLGYTLAFTTFPARYLLTGNRRELHRYTWYYPVYTWANEHTPRKARFLVVVSSGETFHLDRVYRRADPWNSAEVDWRAVGDGIALDAVLACRNLDHLIVEERHWGAQFGGNTVNQAVRSALELGLLHEVASFDLALTRSRFRGGSVASAVSIYARTSLSRPASPMRACG